MIGGSSEKGDERERTEWVKFFLKKYESFSCDVYQTDFYRFCYFFGEINLDLNPF